MLHLTKRIVQKYYFPHNTANTWAGYVQFSTFSVQFSTFSVPLKKISFTSCQKNRNGLGNEAGFSLLWRRQMTGFSVQLLHRAALRETCKGVVDPRMVPAGRSLIASGVNVSDQGVKSRTVRHIFIYCIWFSFVKVFLHLQSKAKHHSEQSLKRPSPRRDIIHMLGVHLFKVEMYFENSPQNPMRT